MGNKPTSALELAPELRNQWVEQHPDYSAALKALANARARAENPPWHPDPMQYTNEAFGARAALAAAEAELDRVRNDLMGVYERGSGMKNSMGGR